jgi:hypothetical protein
MARYSGEFQGSCAVCGEYVEFALGIDTQREPVAMHFGPGGPVAVDLRGLQLESMVDSRLAVKLEYQCPICGQWSGGRLSCGPAPGTEP